MFVEIFGNVVAPAVASIFFFLYFLVFLFTSSKKTLSYRYFLIFLISFSIFLIGRPVQILLGPHPIPLIINNMRSLIFCSVVMTTVLISGSSSEKSFFYKKRRLVVAGGIVLGSIYAIFNTLGTSDSYMLFELGPFTAHDCLSPSMTPPFYGREVTIAAWMVAGLILTTSAAIKIATLEKRKTLFATIKRNKVFHFNVGIIIFGSSLIVGMLLKTWMVYYFSSMLSALFMGFGVIIDIRELTDKMEKVVPFMKENLIQNITYSNVSEHEIDEMLAILGKKSLLDTFIIFMFSDVKEKQKSITVEEYYQEQVEKFLRRELGQEHFLIMPLGTNKLGVCVSMKVLSMKDGQFLLGLGEEMRKLIKRKYGVESSVGIGRTYSSLRDIKLSYHEALTALDYAYKMGKHQVVHIENVQESDTLSRYPYQERERLVFAVKIGDRETALQMVEEIFPKLLTVANNDLMLLRIRLVEIAGTIIDTAISAGGSESTMIELSKRHFHDIYTLKEQKLLRLWFRDFIEEIITSVAESNSSRDERLVEKAKTLIEEQYSDQLRVEDVAQAIFISPSYFKHLFKQVTGKCFTTYLTEIRMRRAKELLASTDKTITEIAYDTGYNDSNYFSTTFKQTYGETPSRFRKRIETLPQHNS